MTVHVAKAAQSAARVKLPSAGRIKLGCRIRVRAVTAKFFNRSASLGRIVLPCVINQALRQELAQHNIRVLALLPSLTETDMVRDLKSFRGVIPMTPEQVAQALVIGIEKDTAEILVGWQSHLAVLCQRLAPWLLDIILQLATPKKPLPDAAG